MRLRWGYAVGATALIACACASACASLVTLDQVDPGDAGATTTSSKSTSGSSTSTTGGSTTTSTGGSESSSTSTTGGGTSTSSTSSSSGSSTSSSGVDSGPPPDPDPTKICSSADGCDGNQKKQKCKDDGTCTDQCSSDSIIACAAFDGLVKVVPCCYGFVCKAGMNPQDPSFCQPQSP